ncbi:MAG: ABC-type multidrug transport system, ATPase component [halophilic archaeon J07HX64]|jgi:ABC-type multidrug transport system, ATPase component|nr:MAG: ABC-type multidrug transport system, ATPase component [halophilic archaeon J07HX64]
MPAIQTQGLTKQYGDFLAVDDLNLTVEEGEIYGFLGPNGAGKTTTINMLLGLIHRSGGSARVLGQEVGDSIREVRGRIGVLPAHSELYDRLTARKHLEFVIGVKDADDDPDALLERVGIPDAADRSAGDFSTGMGQRLRLAMALVDEPDLLVLDEPTSGLDPNGARQMRQIIQEENDRGATVFFSSHIMDQVESVCDRVGVLDQGTLVAEDTVAGLRDTAVGGPQLSVTLGDTVNGAADEVRTVDGVTSVSVEGDTLRASLAGAGVKGPAMNAIASTDSRIADFEFSEESLEDVFATLTGEAEEVTA